jgi:hypothetical protein
MYSIPFFIDDSLAYCASSTLLSPLIDLFIDLLMIFGDYLMQLGVSFLQQERSGGLTAILTLGVLLLLVVKLILEFLGRLGYMLDFLVLTQDQVLESGP